MLKKNRPMHLIPWNNLILVKCHGAESKRVLPPTSWIRPHVKGDEVRPATQVELPLTRGARRKPPSAAFLPGATRTACGAWQWKDDLCDGDGDWQRGATGTEEAISRNAASRKSVIRMPKENCGSFIAGQTKQPGVEGPLEDNIP